MPKKKELFECIHCGKTFTDWAECDKHESTDHTVMLEWSDFKPAYSQTDLYPAYIEVPFLNGATVQYLYNGILQDPDKKDAPIKEGE